MKRREPATRGATTWVVVGLVAVLAMYYFVSRTDSKAKGPVRPASAALAKEEAAPGFALVDLNGQSVSLMDFRGKVVVLDFWATWCPPCRREIPDFVGLQTAYGPQGLQIVGIALDEPEKVMTFARENGMNYPVLIGSDDVVAKYGGIEGIPTTFIIDRSGKIVNRFEGFRPRGVFEEEIKRLL
jgi:peroxiredoxin